MISIKNSTSEPQHVDLLREWFVNEWGKIDSFEGAIKEVVVPVPLLLTEGEKLIGGLAFTSAVKPGGEESAVWVNALFVLPEYRNKGLASKLIQKAISQAQENSIKELFVYTDIPTFYQKQGWRIVDESEASTVLTIVVTN